MDKPTKKKRGRPKGSMSDNPADKTLAGVRVTSDQLEAYKSAAQSSGQNFSQWVRGALDGAVKKVKPSSE